MTKKTKKTSKKSRPRKVLEFPNRGVRPSPGAPARKLSELIKEMALQLLKKPDAIPSESAPVVALMLAGIAWNVANGDKDVLASQSGVFNQIDWGDAVPWAELRSDDIDQQVAELVAYKRKHYPEDPRRIMATELTPEGEVRVHWSEPDKVVAAAFGTTASKPKGARTKPKAARAKSRGAAIVATAETRLDKRDWEDWD